jgi:O-antigen ligase
MFLFYSLLVPYMKFFSFGSNLFSLLIVVALLFNYRIKQLIYKPIYPFLFLYLALLILIPFQDVVPYEIQLDKYRISFMGAVLLPFTVLNVMYNDRTSIRLFTNTLIIAISVATMYSLLLTLTHGLNPYLMLILPLSGGEFNETYAMAESGGRVFGRISGVFTHPMNNGIFLSFAFIFMLSRINLKNRSINFTTLIIMALVLTAIVVIGVRTAVVAVGIGVVFYFILERKFKLIVGGLIVFGILILVLLQIPGMRDFVLSIVDSGSSNVGGSSLDMRVIQLEGCLKEIQNNLLIGKGYGWTSYYRETVGLHPTMLAFESLVFMVLCNSGFIGLSIWIITIYLYFKIVVQNFYNTERTIMIVLMVVYLSYSTITGEYGYMKYLLIFHSVLWANKSRKNLQLKK